MGQSSVPLREQRCRPLGPDAALDDAGRQALLAQVPAWRVVDGALRRRFAFPDFHRTMAFVNAVAWIAHDQDHHPDLDVGYAHCELRWSTHSAGGLTVNDFICAARADALLP